MKYLESGYRGKASHLNILLLNDLHIGSPSSDIDLIDRCIDFALRNEDNTRILLNGDYIEGVIKESKGDIYEQTMSPKEQIDFVVNKLMPVRHLIDGITIGNHDWRVENATSFDPAEILSKDLGLKHKYLGERGIVGFSWNSRLYTVDMHHGTGGGSTLGAIENNMKKIWKSDSDVMYCGHWHKEFVKSVKRYSIDPRNKKINEVKRWLVCGNTALNTAKYAIRAAYEESFPSQAYLILNGEKGMRDIDVKWIR